MKNLFKISLFLICLIFATFMDSVFPYFSLSFVLCISFLLYKKNTSALIICALCGAFRDILFFSLPYFSLVYLYTSLGCVWCAENFLGLNIKGVALISFFAKLSYHILCFLTRTAVYADVFFEFTEVFPILFA